MTPEEEKKLRQRIAELETQIALRPIKPKKQPERYYFELNFRDAHNIKDALRGAEGFVEANFLGQSLKGMDLSRTSKEFVDQFYTQLSGGDKSSQMVNGATAGKVLRVRVKLTEKKSQQQSTSSSN